jgi:hypothetical protein
MTENTRTRPGEDTARERAREANRRYLDRHRDAINERKRQRRAADPERANESQRRWREANLEQARAASRKSERRFREANPDEVRARGRRVAAKLKETVFDHYGHACACCGTTERLTIDHVNGDGDEHRAEVGVGWAIYRWLVKNGCPEGFQTLCQSCNGSKKRGTHCRLSHQEVTQ